jgi:Fic family protein
LAFNDFKKEVKEKFSENRENIRKFMNLWLNERQIRLLNYFLENPDSYTNTTIHQNYNKISRPTAIIDLKHLEEKWFLISSKSWRNINYYSIENLEDFINKK